MSVKSINKLSYILAGFSILLIILGCFAPFVFTQCSSLVDFTATGQIGDTIGGTMSPIVAIAGVFMTFIAFLMQINANRIQSEQLGKTFNLGLLENRIESRNALQLMSVDINVMIKEIDITCESIDTFCAYTEDNPTGDIPFYFTPKQSRSRYTSINRNLVYNAFSFMMSNDFLDDFRTTYSLMDFYSEGIDSLYSAIYKPYTDDIMKIKNQIPVVFEELCDAMNAGASTENSGLLRLFHNNMNERLIKDGILNVLELHKTLNDGRFSSLYDTNFNQYKRILSLTNSLITQNKMMVTAMRDAKEKLRKQETFERLEQLRNRIDTALAEHTIESIQKEFYKQIQGISLLYKIFYVDWLLILDMTGFNSYIDGLNLSALKEHCVRHGRLTQYAKGDYFVNAGEESRHIAYIECGYFNYKVHNSSEGKDYITGFAFEGEFVGDYPNCLSGKKSEVAIVAGTSCKVYQLAGEELCRQLDSDGMRDLKLAISDNLFSQVYTQYLDTYRMTTRERYKRLLLRCPEIVQSINLKDIASYLKVTPTTISNIRREITFGL